MPRLTKLDPSGRWTNSYAAIDHSHRENASDSIIDRSLSSSDEFETRAEEGKEISFRHWKSQQSENTITSDDVSVTEAEI
ncbi:hypothetical protein OUZ56_025394 [Daphnia magna]|uniref:Uncharacterized protein n=1 Tax=Daphnia magna TaxID=35525 RepID=A0ABQ9ZJQ5_9CRUS|nr:hypothetical protein OUZ56_025394 [Daphnia magna]